MTGDNILLTINLSLCCYFDEKLYNKRHESNRKSVSQDREGDFARWST